MYEVLRLFNYQKYSDQPVMDNTMGSNAPIIHDLSSNPDFHV